mmetsp:Transcript_25690/g.52688  ORF Transcript_25690/g.52688 Transcript_25690/m.52688 type:complete len:103 (-) Transcript_25690:207-515(-)
MCCSLLTLLKNLMQVLVVDPRLFRKEAVWGVVCGVAREVLQQAATQPTSAVSLMTPTAAAATSTTHDGNVAADSDGGGTDGSSSSSSSSVCPSRRTPCAALC